MGLGMGGTMMPLMTSALRTLKHAEVARGSTLLNITQQIASSVGVAVISVVLTNQYKDSQGGTAAQGIAEAERNGVEPPPALVQFAQSFGDRFESIVKSDMADAFGDQLHGRRDPLHGHLDRVALPAAQVRGLPPPRRRAGAAPPVVIHLVVLH